MADLPDYYTAALLAFTEVESIRGGFDADKEAAPDKKDVYLATDTGILYVCLADGAWTNIGTLYLLLAGGTMTGPIAMGTNKITGLGDPTLAQDAATRAYVLAQCGLYLPLAGGTLTGNLTMAATKKIIIPIDGAVELVTHIGNCLLRGGELARFEYQLIVQPASGNKTSHVNIVPLGTEDGASVDLLNSSDLENFGYISFSIDGTFVNIYAAKVGTGTAPTTFTINLSPKPSADAGQSLGVAATRWSDVHSYHHNITQALGTDHTWSGITAPMTAGAALTRGQAVYVGGDSKMELADADEAASMPVIALVTPATLAENAEGEFLLQGFFRDDTWDWTPGGLLYASVTPGGLSQTAPVGSGDQVQVVGVAITADIIHFNPSYELVEIS